ncbi:MAG: tRNA (cytidine(34)-2'-O)-methyltransferase [Hyphomonadaceae bacterium]
MRLAFYQPDIPQNLGAAIRLAACFGLPLDVIEPCGFPLTDRALKRAAMDYAPAGGVIRHDGWRTYRENLAQGPNRRRIVLFTTSGAVSLDVARFEPDDILLFGRESAGVPQEVHDAADLTVRTPIHPQARSLNVVTCAAIAVWEALRQCDALPHPDPARRPD